MLMFAAKTANSTPSRSTDRFSQSRLLLKLEKSSIANTKNQKPIRPIPLATPMIQTLLSTDFGIVTCFRTKLF